MEWWAAFLIIMGSLFVLMFIGMPVAFTFLVVNVVGGYIFFAGIPGMLQLMVGYNSVFCLQIFPYAVKFRDRPK